MIEWERIIVEDCGPKNDRSIMYVAETTFANFYITTNKEEDKFDLEILNQSDDKVLWKLHDTFAGNGTIEQAKKLLQEAYISLLNQETAIVSEIIFGENFNG